MQKRVAIALTAGVIAWAFAALRVRAAGPYFMAGDFTTHWRAADAMLHGFSPYTVINAMPVYPFGAGYLYMLPAAVLLLPFGTVAPQIAMPLFSGISAAVLAFAMTREGYWRLPLLLSAPMLYAVSAGQTVPLVMAAFLVPALGWLAPIKFTLGAVGAAYTLSARYVALAAAVVVASIARWPWWPLEWWRERADISGVIYHVPALTIVGAFALLALLRWRRPEARLLAAMACVPQTMFFYDQLPLGLVARSRQQALAFAVASWAGPLLLVALHGVAPMDRERLFGFAAPIIVAIYYLPCVVIVLRRPNEGPA